MPKFGWSNPDKELEREKKAKAKVRKYYKGSRSDWKRIFGAK